MTKFLIALSALALSGCASLPSAINKAIPDGTYKTMNFQAATNFGSVVISGDGITKGNDVLTATDLSVTVSSPVQPILSFTSQGYAPPSPTPAPAPAGATAPTGPPAPNVVIHLK